MNINEIAKLSGVSRATVSRYLNDGYVSEEKKDKIKEVIEKTGYKPSSQAQMLRTKKTGVVGVILPKINSDSISRMVSGISSILLKAGYQLLLANTDNNELEEINYLKMFKGNHVDGIILVGTIFTAEHKKAMSELSVPIVVLGQKVSGYSCVYNDDYNAAFDITNELIKHCKCPGYIGVTKKDKAAGKARFDGYCDALAKNGIDAERTAFCEAEFSMDSGKIKAEELINKVPKTDAIFCSTDTIAVGAMLYLREINKRIPKDIMLCGMGDGKISKITTPTLSTVNFHYKTSGIEAGRMLVDMMESKEYVKKEIKMGYDIIVRESMS